MVERKLHCLVRRCSCGLVRPFPSPSPQLACCVGQSSRNKLIVFADRTYLELFCWISTPREYNAWANKAPGVLDFALASMPPSTANSLHNDIVSRLGEKQSSDKYGLNYTLPKSGSRSRRDGVQVKWESSRPVSTNFVDRTRLSILLSRCHISNN